MRFLAIIPARSGSTRIKHKNIKLVAGYPMMYYQIDAAKKIKDIDKIILATDEEYYAKIAKSFGIEVIMRPPEISGPKSKTEETLLYVLDELEKKGEKYDAVILLQITNPLNKSEYIQEAIDKMNTGKYKSVVTYSDFKRFFMNDPDLIERPMSQDREPRKLETGCFWITDVESLREKNSRIVEPFAMVKVSSKASLEIDDEEELAMIESFLEREMRLKEGRYFKKRGYEGDFEDYYGSKEDPDGVIRDLRNEKEKRIAMVKTEIDFINNLENKKGKKFLDIGCGLGFTSSAISEDYNKYGLEVSKQSAEFAKQFIKNLHAGQLEKDTYPEEFFDVILCNHVIEHIPDPIEFIKNVRRILKTHGHLIISSPNFDSGAARRFKDKYRMLHDKTHISLFTDFSLKQMLEDYGFIVDNIDYPFFEIEYFTKENLLRLFDTSNISPPFYGNFMTLYCRKK